MEGAEESKGEEQADITIRGYEKRFVTLRCYDGSALRGFVYVAEPKVS